MSVDQGQQLLTVFETFPVISLGDVVMRALHPTDAPEILAYTSHAKVKRYLSDEDIPKDFKAAVGEVEYWGGLFERKQSIYWAIADAESGKLIGTCGYNFWNTLHAKAEVSYDLAYPYWGRGIMTRVLGAAIAFGFESMQLNRIMATVSPSNKISVHLLEKLGFMHEGCMREYKKVRGKYEDALVYGLLVRDFKK